MNLLIDVPPETATVSHTEYPIRYDYKSCLRIILAFEDDTLTPQEKQAVLLRTLFVDMPTDIKAAVEKANLFLNGGETAEEDKNPMRLYSFAKDANLIFAAFRQTHNIDLQTDNLHWWKFLALFMDLGQDTTFCQLVALRRRLKTGKASAEEKQAAREMRELIDVPEIDDRTLEEKIREDEFMQLVRGNHGS